MDRATFDCETYEYECVLYDNFRGFLTLLFDNKNMLLMLHSQNYRLVCNDIPGYCFRLLKNTIFSLKILIQNKHSVEGVYIQC